MPRKPNRTPEESLGGFLSGRLATSEKTIERVFARVTRMTDRVVKNNWQDRAVGKLSANPKADDEWDDPTEA